MIKDLIRQFEGYRYKAYRCAAGVWTVGYGHTRGVKRGDTATRAEADRLLDEDLRPILPLIPEGLSVNRRAALASLAFNIGPDAFRKSTILKKVKANPDDPSIRDEFLRWVNAKGKVIPGLVNRRKLEAGYYFMVFFTMSCSSNHSVADSEQLTQTVSDTIRVTSSEQLAATLHHVTLTDTTRRTIVIERVEIARSAEQTTQAAKQVETIATQEHAEQLPAPASSSLSPLWLVVPLALAALAAILGRIRR